MRRSPHRPARSTPSAIAIALLGSACSLSGDTGEPARPAPLPGPGTMPTATEAALPPPPPAAALRPVAPAFEVASTSAAIDAWPRIVPGVTSRAVTSFDRSGGNDDGFGGTYSELYVDARGEHVIVDATGPGVLRTLWFTSAVSGDAPLSIGLVRFYFDDEDEPRLVINANELFAGARAPFVAPLVAANFASSGGFASWAPLPYRARLRVTTERRAGFYQAHYDALPADWDVASYAPGTTDTALAARFAASTSTLPLEEVALDVARPGAGVVDVVRFVPDAAPTDAALRSARIRVWFDGAAEPQVDLPLGFFFGSGIGVAPVASIAWTMQPLLLESRLPMPFWDGVRLAVSGISGTLSLHVGAQRWAREEAGTLETRFREEAPAAPGADFVYADVTGAGKIVATVLGVDPLVASAKKWWEGDLRTTIDGARSPAIHGTGHEDDHLGGWSNEFLSRPFTLPMHGSPRTDLLDTGAEFQKNGRSTMYRLWPGIPFYRGARHSTEHGAGNSVGVTYAAATFLYRQPRERKVRTDAFDVADAAAATAHAYDAPGRTEASLSSAFEGERSEGLSATLHEYAAPARFSLAIDPDNEGVDLRRLFDRAEAPGEAALEVDGVRVTTVRTWGPVAPARTWVERDVFIPAQITRGKSRIEVRWVPDTTPKPAGAPPRRCNAARFEAWSILP